MSEILVPWAAILDCIQAGVAGDPQKARRAAKDLLERLRADGNERIAWNVQRILEEQSAAVVPVIPVVSPAKEQGV
ncbi:hypothetical protein ccbrp13_71550 [Ktedonobacteria bacterium brp13]|nr:hypothetical protein ccbrp13_71550 [Ktedonobacteria bacterium brp13]